jgi:hypothetical protein
LCTAERGKDRSRGREGKWRGEGAAGGELRVQLWPFFSLSRLGGAGWEKIEIKFSRVSVFVAPFNCEIAPPL